MVQYGVDFTWLEGSILFNWDAFCVFGIFPYIVLVKKSKQPVFSAVLLSGIFGHILDFFQSTSGTIGDGYYYGFFNPVIFSFFGLIDL